MLKKLVLYSLQGVSLEIFLEDFSDKKTSYIHMLKAISCVFPIIKIKKRQREGCRPLHPS